MCDVLFLIKNAMPRARGRHLYRLVLGTAAWHGRMLIINRHCAAESTGHGSPLPHLVHGGPGRAGGGEELGGVRGVQHYLHRAALQGPRGVVEKIAGVSPP